MRTCARKTRNRSPWRFDQALYLELAAPNKMSFSRCNDAQINFWDSKPSGGHWTRMPGLYDRLWIVDVDGQPMMLAMFVRCQRVAGTGGLIASRRLRRSARCWTRGRDIRP